MPDFLKSYTATDPTSKCRAFAQELAGGRWAVQVDDGAINVLSKDEWMDALPNIERDIRWLVFEILRRHLNDWPHGEKKAG